MPKKARNLVVETPGDEEAPFSITRAGTFEENNVVINAEGMDIRGTPRPSRRVAGRGQVHGEDALDADRVAPTTVRLRDLKVLRDLGKGAGGEVRLVSHVPDGELMAMKVIKLDIADDMRKQILRELTALYQSSCEYVVSMHGAFFEEGNIYICLEYMDCGSLADLQKSIGGIIPEIVCAKIAYGACQGLRYIHKELKIIHRDIKPANMLVNSRGQVKICDFGVSGKLQDTVASITSWIGTSTYMAPERIKGESYNLTSDYWSLGLTLIELATGRYPYNFGGRVPTFWDLLNHIMQEPAPSLSPAAATPEFCDFVAKCLIKDVKERPSETDLIGHVFVMRSLEEPFDMQAWVHASCPAAVNAARTERAPRLSAAAPAPLGNPMNVAASPTRRSEEAYARMREHEQRGT